MMASVGYLEIFFAIFGSLFLWCLRNNGLPRDWPMVGMQLTMIFHLHRLHDKCSEILERSKGTILFKGARFIGMDLLTTSDPANALYITSKNFSNYPKGADFKEIFEVLGDAAFNSDSDEWRRQRKVLHAFFNHQKFQQVAVKTFRESLEQGLIPVLEHLSEQNILVDLQDLFDRLMYDTTCTLITGYDPCSLRVDFPEIPFSKAMDDACEAIFYKYIVPRSLLKLQNWLGFGQQKKLSDACKTLDNIITKFLLKKREELSNGAKLKDDEENFDALQFYMTEDEIVGPTATDKTVKDNILALIFGGRDTTSSALSWFFWLISQNPSTEAKIIEELQAHFPRKEGKKLRLFYNSEEVSKLVYLHGAFCETLRLFPPAPFVPRTPLQPDILPSGHSVNPKTKVILSVYAMGRMTSVWGNDCLEFKPERWITENGGIKREPSHKFSAFNGGPRICPGKELAFTRIKAVAATIMYNYNIQVAGNHPVTLIPSVVLKMKQGLIARVEKRRA